MDIFFPHFPLPNDDDHQSFYHALVHAPYPPYPSSFNHALFPTSLYHLTLHPILPISFSILYLLTAALANRWTSRTGRRDFTKTSPLLSSAVKAHNALILLFSAWVFVRMTPLAVDYFVQGYRALGWDGLKAALCTMPTGDASTLSRFAYLFYMSKYWEVIDSVILAFKGKEIGTLQRYHHAGALMAMWIAVRYRSNPVWVFCCFNSGVHTLMYSYYLCSAMRIPFPKRLKRNLTTLQIVQIASGTILTNIYLLIRIRPAAVAAGIATHGVSPALSSEGQSLGPYILSRAASSDPGSCLVSTGAVLALHVNTMYMLPLLGLFAQFFIGSYLVNARNGSAKEVEVRPNGNGTAAPPSKGVNGHGSKDL